MRQLRNEIKGKSLGLTPHETSSVHTAAIFRCLGDQDLQRLLREAPYREYSKGAIVLEPEPGDHLCIIARGGIRLSLLSQQGRSLTLRSLRPGDIFDMHDVDTAESLMDGTCIYSIQWDRFLRHIYQHPDAVFALVTILRQRACQDHVLLKDVAFETMHTRLGRALVMLARENPEHNVQEKHSEFGALVGAEREDVTKAFSHFRRLGLIRSAPDHKGIQVLQEEGLTA